MTNEQMQKCQKTLDALIKKHKSLREFARQIREDASDIIRWRAGDRPMTARAVVAICRLYPEIKPCLLNPEIFSTDVAIHFTNQ